MTVREIWIDGTIDGRPYVGKWDWAKNTLSEEELKEFYAAEDRQFAYRQKAIDRGDLVLDDHYRWRDQAAFVRHKKTDDVWLKYFLRWREECGIIDGRKIINEDEQK